MAEKPKNETAEKPKKATVTLVVVHPFATYKRGDQITDAKEVEQVLKSNRQNIVPVKES